MSTGIGKRIKKRRKDLGLSQEELANRMGLKSKSTICKVEKGDDNLTSDTVQKYADALDTTPLFLMGWSEFPQTVTGDQLDVVAVEKVTEDSPNYKRDHLYELYEIAPPEIQAAIDTMLGYRKPDA